MSRRSLKNTRWCQFVFRSHDCRHGRFCDHAHTWAEYNLANAGHWPPPGEALDNGPQQIADADHAAENADAVAGDANRAANDGGYEMARYMLNALHMQIYAIVYAYDPALAARITGMLLDPDSNSLHVMMSSEHLMWRRIKEARDILLNIGEACGESVCGGGDSELMQTPRHSKPCEGHEVMPRAGVQTADEVNREQGQRDQAAPIIDEATWYRAQGFHTGDVPAYLEWASPKASGTAIADPEASGHEHQGEAAVEVDVWPDTRDGDDWWQQGNTWWSHGDQRWPDREMVKSGWDVMDEITTDSYFWSIHRNYEISHPLLVAASRQAIEEFLDNQANETEEEDEYEHKRVENKRAEAAVRSVEAEKVKRNEDAETDAVAGDANRAAKDSDHEMRLMSNTTNHAVAKCVVDAYYEQRYKSCNAHEPALAGNLTDEEVACNNREWAERKCWYRDQVPQYDTSGTGPPPPPLPSPARNRRFSFQ